MNYQLDWFKSRCSLLEVESCLKLPLATQAKTSGVVVQALM